MTDTMARLGDVLQELLAAVKPKEPEQTPDFMSIDEFADYLRVSKSTVKRRIRDGLPTVRVTGRIRVIDVQRAIQWMRARDAA